MTTMSPTFPALSHREESEAYRALVDIAHGRTGSIPTDLLVRHVLTLHTDADWPVQRAAMEAVIRRCAIGKRDGLRVSKRPKGHPLGTYETGRKPSMPRPYSTQITAVDPILASCDCADFLRSSLGVCKHALAVLNEIFSRPRVHQRATRSRAAQPIATPLRWNPVRPLSGDGDWLERVSLHLTGDRAEDERILSAVGAHFTPARDGRAGIRSGHAFDVDKRLALVDDLNAVLARTAAVTAEPALRVLLDDERERLRQMRADRLSAAEIQAALRSMTKRPYPYQRSGIAKFLACERLLLADDMGLGKTVQAIAGCHVLWHTKRVQRGLLVVPASLKSQWLREWRSFSPTPIEVVDGSPEERRAAYGRNKRGFLLVNYELLLRDFDAVRSWNPQMVVLDEAQRIKNWATKTALSVKRLSPRYRLVLTGTPMENRLDELASVFDWVDGFALEPKWRLTPWHSAYGDGGREIRGARNLDTLRARLAPAMLRRTRREVLDQLPPRTDSVIPVEPTDEQRDEHDALIQPIATLVARARRRPLTQTEFLRLMSLLTTQRIIANGLAQLRFSDIFRSLTSSRPEPALLQTLHTPKLLELREIIDQVVIQQGRKVVVFSQWRRMLQLATWAISDLLAAAGKRAVYFTGREGQQRRTQNIVDLHDDPTACVLFATDSGGVGLNLQRAATCCINIDLPWNPAVLEQRIGRIYRLGQEQPISVYNLITRDTIEERIAGLVADKKALFSSLFEGKTDSIEFDRSGSFLAQMERIVMPTGQHEREEEEGDDDETAIERELDEVLAAGDETADLPVTPPLHATDPGHPRQHAPTEQSNVRDLFARLQVTRKSDGGLSIEAPPEVADTLAAMLAEMATLLQGVRAGQER